MWAKEVKRVRKASKNKKIYDNALKEARKIATIKTDLESSN